MTKNARWMVVGLAALAIGVSIAAIMLMREKPALTEPAVASIAAAPNAAIEAKPVEKENAPTAAEKPASEPTKEAAFPSATEGRDRTGRGRIHGKVVPPEGTPSGLEVTVNLHAVPDSDSKEFTYDDTLRASVKTDAQGAFEFTKIPFGTYVVFAYATGLTNNTTEALSAKYPDQEVNLTLYPAGPIAGHVVNEKHEPVKGARVFVAGWDILGQKRFAELARGLASQQITDDKGTFAMPFLRMSQGKDPGYLLAVKADGYATLLSEYIKAGTQDVELMVKPGGVVNGMLVSLANGEALPNKTITVDSDVAVETLKATTDAEGFFFLTDVPPGAHTASLRDEELVITPETAKFQVADGAPAGDIVFQAAPGARITGRIFDTDTNNGVAGVKMYLQIDGAGDYAESKEKTTDASGQFKFAGLKAGQYHVSHGKPEGYPDDYRDNNRAVAANIGAETSGVDFSVTRGLVITGVVVDEKGDPLSDVSVYANDQKGISDNTQSKKDGTFQLAGFAVGSNVTVNASKKDYALLSAEPAKGKVTMEEKGTSGVRLVLGESASISGVVVGKTGAPMPNVQMWVQSPSQVSPGSNVEQSGADGTVTFTSLAPGEYTFNFEGMQVESNSKNAQRVKVAKGEKVTGVRIQYPVLEGASVSGRVVDARGKGVSSVEMTLNGRVWRQGQSDSNGNFKFDGVSAGQSWITARSASYSSPPQKTVQAGDTGVEIVLQDLASVEGRVISARSGQPVPAFRIRSVGSSSGQQDYNRQQFIMVNDPEGKFSLTKVEDGATALEVRTEGFADVSVPLAGIKGGDSRKDILVRMEDAVTLAGHVKDAEGKGVGGAMVFIGMAPQEWQREEQRRATTASDGSFTLASLGAGPAQLSVTHQRFATKSASVNLVAGVENKVDIIMSSGGTIEGTVTVDGKPAVDQYVGVSVGRGQDQRNVQTDAKGHYLIAGLPEGTARLNPGAQMPGGGWRGQTASVEVKDGFVTEMNFEFRSGTSTIEGTVYTAPNEPLKTEARLSLNISKGNGASEYLSAQTDANGAFIFEGVPAGQATIQAYIPGGTPKRIAVSVGENEQIRQDILLYGGGTVRVRVSGGNGPVVAVSAFAGKIEIREISQSFFESVGSQHVASAPVQNGEATLTGMDPGTYTILVISYDPKAGQSPTDALAGAQWTSTTIEVEKDKEASVELKL